MTTPTLREALNNISTQLKDAEQDGGLPYYLRGLQQIADTALAAQPELPEAVGYFRAGATLPEYGGWEICRKDDAGSMPFYKDAQPELPQRDQSQPTEHQGLFRKFDVRRTDGSDEPGGKHHGCRYFVLDVEDDAHANAAPTAYAAACEATHPQLARDLREKWGAKAQPELPEPKWWVNGERLNEAFSGPHKSLIRLWINHHKTEEDDVGLYTAAEIQQVAGQPVQWENGVGLLWDVYAFGKLLKRVVSPINSDAHAVYLALCSAGYSNDIDVKLSAASDVDQTQAKREPMSESDILKALGSFTHEVPSKLPKGWKNFARAVEAHHNIGGKK